MNDWQHWNPEQPPLQQKGHFHLSWLDGDFLGGPRERLDLHLDQEMGQTRSQVTDHLITEEGWKGADFTLKCLGKVTPLLASSVHLALLPLSVNS